MTNSNTTPTKNPLAPVGGDRQTPDMSAHAIKDAIANLNKTPAHFQDSISTFMKRRSHLSHQAHHALTGDEFTRHLINPTELGKLGDVSTITDLRTYFKDTPNGAHAPLTLEIGFGMGDSLVAMAKADPARNFIGIEVHEAGIGRCVHSAHELGLPNLKIINGDAIALLDNLPDEHIDTIQLFFPDPWQKKRHYKRRFVTHERIKKVVRTLKVGGIFHVATDWEHYARWSLQILDDTPQLSNLAGLGNFSPRPDFRPATKFEKRGADYGRSSWDLLYQKVHPNL